MNKFELKINKKISLVIPEVDSASVIFPLIDSDREHLREWLPWVDVTLSVKDVEQNLVERIETFERKEQAVFYVLYEKQFVASAGFVKIDHKNKKGEIGYWILSGFQGRGIITESVKSCIKYGFEELGLNKIIIRCSKENQKSAAIPERLGFTLEGVLRQEDFRNDAFEDLLFFGLLRNEYEN